MTGSKRVLIASFLWISSALLLSSALVQAQEKGSAGTVENQKVLSLFWREGCGHCKREKEFLEVLKKRMPNLEIMGLNIDKPEDREVFDTFTKLYNLPKVTPVTVVGRKFIVGFDKPETTGAEIERLLETEAADLTVEELLTQTATREEGAGGTCSIAGPSTPCEAGLAELRYLDVPLFGKIDLVRFTLPMLSLVLGFVDGFNPCAMWVLVAFLTALAQVGSTKKMIQFAGVFILAEAIMYFLILNSWFMAFDFIKADRIVTPLVGLVAIGGGIFFLWEFWKSDPSCKVTSFEKRAKTSALIDSLARRSFTPMVIIAILGIAFSVNIVEFACSIGIPQAYTKILDINQVGLLKRELLMGIYIFFYMVDDLAVFALAVVSIEKIGLTTRYSRACNLLGGIIMLILGLFLIFAPQKLRF